MDKEDRDLLIRVDERTKNTHDMVKDLNDSFASRVKVCDDLFVKKTEFEPIQKTFYIVTRTIAVALVMGVLTLLGWHAV